MYVCDCVIDLSKSLCPIGGTLDVTVRQVMKDKTLQEVLCASGGPWGGMSINKEFWRYVYSVKTVCGSYKIGKRDIVRP